MSSGVKVDPDCIEAFNNFKLGKKEAFLLFGFNENATKIIVLHKESKTSTQNDDLKVKSKIPNKCILKMPWKKEKATCRVSG